MLRSAVSLAASCIGELVFPSKCIQCARRGTLLCDTCRPELPYLPNSVCGRCAALRYSISSCASCARLSPALATIRAPFAYAGAARRAVLALKFRSGRILAPLMGELLCASIRDHRIQADLVVPVPLATARQRDRGFNQAALLAVHVAPAVGGTPVELLTRRDRASQQTLDAAARLANLHGAISCRTPEAVRGKRVLLVDDVVTTGATVSACADTLAQAGARRVAVLAFARDL